jgi:exopolyphosphatase/guanosine-5'-triphosphate,3'-diphosphate pyrophosphatase
MGILVLGQPAKNSHFHFAAISQDNKQKVMVLASILRIADGMDASHLSVVTNIDLTIDHDSVMLNCFVSNDTSLERESILKKKDLFESTIGKQLIVKWIRIATKLMTEVEKDAEKNPC